MVRCRLAKNETMKKTLIVSYTPRIGSYTKVLVDYFKEASNNKTAIKHIKLEATPPDLLLPENLELLTKWNSGQREFTKTENAVMANHFFFIEELLDADYVVLASPIYNFNLPATVKAWVDAIVVSEKTFHFNPESGFSGLCNEKRALSILVAGFDYPKNSLPKEFATATLKQNFDFIGMSTKYVSAFGVDQHRDNLEHILDRAKENILRIINNWY